MRSGQQAALGQDLIDLLDALGIQRAILAGYDWGGLSSCVASALWPERVTGLVSYAGYDIIDVGRLGHAYTPALEQVLLSMAEIKCAGWRRDSVPVWLRKKGVEALASFLAARIEARGA